MNQLVRSYVAPGLAEFGEGEFGFAGPLLPDLPADGPAQKALPWIGFALALGVTGWLALR